jgi:hypothetical protein
LPKPKPTPAAGLLSSSGSGDAPQRIAGTRQFEAPPVKARRSDPAPQILLQADADEPTLQGTVAPSMAILSRVLNRRTFVRPPETKERAIPSQPVLVDAPPPLLGDARTIVTSNKLPLDRPPVLPAPSGMPATAAGDARASTPPESVSTVRGSGTDGANIVSLPSRALPLAETIVIPRVRFTTSGGGDAFLGEHGAQNGAFAAGAGTGVAGAGGDGAADGSGSASGGVAGSGSSLWTRNGDTPPLRGELDSTVRGFVVTQTNSFIPGAAGLLAGRPVYTIYIATGEGREWVLQYCLPAAQGNAAAAERNGNVVALGGITPLDAPRAAVIFRPVLRFKARVRYAFLHGTINTSGKIEDLSVAGPAALDNGKVVLDAVRQWEFRPAAKDGAPVAVEVLICIPYTPA